MSLSQIFKTSLIALTVFGSSALFASSTLHFEETLGISGASYDFPLDAMDGHDIYNVNCTFSAVGENGNKVDMSAVRIERNDGVVSSNPEVFSGGKSVGSLYSSGYAIINIESTGRTIQITNLLHGMSLSARSLDFSQVINMACDAIPTDGMK